MNVLISGGSKNGKTGFAQDAALRLSGGGRHFYVATMIPYDGEDRARIARHIEERAGLGFETLEIPRDIASCLTAGGADATYLVDSVTALLLNEMYPGSFDAEADPRAAERCRDGLLKLAAGAKTRSSSPITSTPTRRATTPLRKNTAPILRRSTGLWPRYATP